MVANNALPELQFAAALAEQIYGHSPNDQLISLHTQVAQIRSVSSAAQGGFDARIGCSDGMLFSYVDLEDRVPAKYSLRMIRAIVNEVLASLDADSRRCIPTSAASRFHERQHGAVISPERAERS